MTRFVTQAVTAWAACWTFSAACFWAGHRLSGGHRD